MVFTLAALAVHLMYNNYVIVFFIIIAFYRTIINIPQLTVIAEDTFDHVSSLTEL